MPSAGHLQHQEVATSIRGLGSPSPVLWPQALCWAYEKFKLFWRLTVKWKPAPGEGEIEWGWKGGFLEVVASAPTMQDREA